MFQVLIHPALYLALREHQRPLRDRFLKTLRRLRDGLWGGGTRVKRLAGCLRPLYEARLDAGNRILFTVVPSADRSHPTRLAPHLQVWDLATHDGVKKAGRRNPAPEAEFLELAILEEHEITEPPPCPEADLAEVPGGEGEEGLLHYLLPPDGLQVPAAEAITGGTRWFFLDPSALAGEEEFQRLIDRGGEELELKLTREQYDILRAPGPVLLAGSAGSGKTTIAIHRIAEAAGSGRALYLSYSSWLKDHASRLFGDLLASRGLAPGPHPPRFLTFDDLYRELAGRPEERLVTAFRFEEWFRMSGWKLDPALVWEEIRSILKGACRDLERPMLDREAYLELGRKRAPLFVAERPEIFRLGRSYQEWLQREGRVDQIDLCRLAFRALKAGHRRPYEAVVCDEVQDLTELEVAFVAALAAAGDLSRLFLAGDSQQIVNPSGFRWAEVRQLLRRADRGRQREAPPLFRLRRNFRSVLPLVGLANAILGLRREIFGRSDEDEEEEAVVRGPVPVQVAAPEPEVLAAIAGFGPRCAVLVLDEGEGERLRRRLETTRVFTVPEAKGLEFETVILWKALGGEEDPVERMRRGEGRLDRDSRLKRFLQHLYVAVTRARRHLALYEGPSPHSFWAAERFRGHLEKEGAEALPRLFRSTASPEEWAKEGKYYLKRGRFRQAAECFRRAGFPEREREALALFAEAIEEWATAAVHWEALGEPARLGPVLERLGRLEEALACFRKAGLEAEARRCEIGLLERRGRWEEAARLWEEEGRPEEALRCHRRAGNRQRSLALEAAAAEKAGEWARAAACREELGEWREAARCHRRIKDRAGAARVTARGHEEAGRLKQAALAYVRAGLQEKAVECRARALEEAGEHLKAARAWERLGNPKRARACRARLREAEPMTLLRPAPRPARDPQTITLREVQELEAKGGLEEPLLLAQARAKHLSATIAWGKELAARELRPDSPVAEFLALRSVINRCLARQEEKRGAWAAAARHWTEAREPERAKAAGLRAAEKISDPQRRAKTYIRLNEFDRAVEIFAGLGLENEAAAARARQAQAAGKWRQAAALWRALGLGREENRCLAQEARESNDWVRAAAFHRLAGQATLARDAERRAKVEARRKLLLWGQTYE